MTTVTKEMIGAAHDVMLAKGDFVLSANLLERIYLAMAQSAPPPQTQARAIRCGRPGAGRPQTAGGQSPMPPADRSAQSCRYTHCSVVRAQRSASVESSATGSGRSGPASAAASSVPVAAAGASGTPPLPGHAALAAGRRTRSASRRVLRLPRATP